MDRIKAKGYLNISHKGGYLVIGSDKLDGYDKKLFLILIDEKAGKNSKKIGASFKDVKLLEVENLEELVSIRACKIVGVKNKQLSEKIIEALSD